MRPDRIPLFPLNVVLFPGEQLPLHIFEPRYRRMVRDCLDTTSPFGMLLAMDDGITRVGCTAEILEIIKRYPDGRRIFFRVWAMDGTEEIGTGTHERTVVDIARLIERMTAKYGPTPAGD